MDERHETGHRHPPGFSDAKGPWEFTAIGESYRRLLADPETLGRPRQRHDVGAPDQFCAPVGPGLFDEGHDRTSAGHLGIDPGVDVGSPVADVPADAGETRSRALVAPPRKRGERKFKELRELPRGEVCLGHGGLDSVSTSDTRKSYHAMLMRRNSRRKLMAMPPPRTQPGESAADETAAAVLKPEKVFARQLRTTRERRGWTQAQLAERLSEMGVKLAQSALSKIESGERGVGLDECLSIAAALGVSPGSLAIPKAKDLQLEIAPSLVVDQWQALLWWRSVAPLDPGASDEDRRFFLEGRSDIEDDAIWSLPAIEHVWRLALMVQIHAGRNEVRQVELVANQLAASIQDVQSWVRTWVESDGSDRAN